MEENQFKPMSLHSPNTPSKKKFHILFVCLGNICRSPTGEAVLKKIALENNLTDYFHIESAGTGNYHIGERPDPRTRRHGEKRGLQFESLAQQFNPDLHFHLFDYILCMDHNNLQQVQKLDSQQKYHAKVIPIMSFAPESGYQIVPDPYTGGPQDFELVIDLLETACLQFFQQIKMQI